MTIYSSRYGRSNGSGGLVNYRWNNLLYNDTDNRYLFRELKVWLSKDGYNPGIIQW